MSTYQQFAHIYDKMKHDEFSVRMFNYTQRILKRLRYRPKSVLDLACGTGTAAVKWAGNNVKTFGIDGSEHMLEIAQIKADDEHAPVMFSRQSMASFSLPQQVDLVTCYFDSINYLLSLDDVERCFKSVNRALYPSGYFIFDFNTPEAMKTLWDTQTYADESDDLAWIWKNCYFAKTKQAQIRATFFVRQGDIWERFDEIHAERGYTITEIKKLLMAAGFQVNHVYDCLHFTKPDRQSVRVAIVARKK